VAVCCEGFAKCCVRASSRGIYVATAAGYASARFRVRDFDGVFANLVQLRASGLVIGADPYRSTKSAS
jgi:hypothetical protein